MGAVLQHPQRRTRKQSSERKGQEGKKLTTAHDIYQLLVGEIGIPRREFLYEIDYWEVLRIIRGYRRRDRLKHQLLAECAYAAIYAMRDPKGKTVADMFPDIFDDEEEEDDTPPMSEEEMESLQQLMRDNPTI